MTQPHYHIQEDDHGRYEVHEAGAGASITIKDTLDEAIAWVKRMAGGDAPDQSQFHSPTAER